MNEWTNEWTNEQTTNPLYCCWRSQLRLHSQMVNDTLESVTSSGCTVTSYYMVCSYAFCYSACVIVAILWTGRKYNNIHNNVKGELINMTRAWDKEKIWVPDRNWTHDLPNTWRALCPFWATRTRGEQGHLTEFICGRRPAFCYTYSVCKMVRFIYFGFFFKGI